jgi:hypothetical protein
VITVPTFARDAAVYESRSRREQQWSMGSLAGDAMTSQSTGDDFLGHPLDSTIDKLRTDAPATKHLESYARAYVRASLEPKYEMLLRQRQQLVLKRLTEPLAPSEQQGLRYAQWRIDRYEEAMLGDNWDRLKASISQQRSLGEEIRSFAEDLKSTASTVLQPRRR